MSSSTLPSGETVYDPRGVVDAVEMSLAPRPERLAGARVGVLDNSKWNAGALLRHTVHVLEASVGEFAEVRFYKKDSFSSYAPPEMLREIAEQTDVVLTAIGD
jgi:hypothetical protein